MAAAPEREGLIVPKSCEGFVSVEGELSGTSSPRPSAVTPCDPIVENVIREVYT